LPHALVPLDDELRLRTGNRAFYDTFECTPAEVVGQPLRTIVNGMLDHASVSSLLTKTLGKGNQSTERTEVALTLPGNEQRRFQLSARRLPPEPGKHPLILLIIEKSKHT
jgi:hypothetical protein